MLESYVMVSGALGERMFVSVGTCMDCLLDFLWDLGMNMWRLPT